MRRRTLLQMLAAAAAWLRLSPASGAQAPTLTAGDETRLRAIADVVLPSELDERARGDVVDAFVRWVRNYHEGAEMEHGYGFPRLRRTPASPGARYPAQLASLDRAARARGGPLESLEAAKRREVIEAEIVAAKVERLPGRPTGDHVATDLMAFYFNGPDANDLAYGAAIGRDQCRGLPDSDKRPSALRGQTRVATGSEQDATPMRPRSDQGRTALRPRSEQDATLLRPRSDRDLTPLRTGSDRVASQLRPRFEHGDDATQVFGTNS